MILENVKKQQANFISKIYEPKTVCGDYLKTDFFKYIKNYNLLDLESALGKFGVKLKHFIDLIDEDHPDLANIFNGQFISENDNVLGRHIVDLLKLNSFAKHENISNKYIDLLKKLLIELDAEKILTKIDSPITNQSYIRFVKSKEIRNFIRLKKIHQFFSIGNYPEQIWNATPVDLDFVSRYKNVFEGEIEKVENRRLLFKQHGLEHMALEAEKEISYLRTSAEEKQYLGFNEIPIKFLALLLAKMNGFEQTNISKNINKYVLQKEKLPQNVLTKDYSELEVQCTLYNCRNCLDFIPQKLQQLIEHLDELPELGNRPAFDRFRIVLTTVKLPNQNGCVYELQNTSSKIEIFSDYNQAQHALNYRLVQTSQTIGGLLGERDGVHYFISYFM